MRALERAIVRAAVNIKTGGSYETLTAAVDAYLSDEARKDRPSRECCGLMSLGWGMSCQRPAGHPLDSEKPHEGFDRRGYRRHWRTW